MRMTIEERFWGKVKKREDGCWVWNAGVGGKGYGHFKAKGSTHVASRVAYVISGRVLPEGVNLHHLCQNKLCVNPSHMAIKSPDKFLTKTGKEWF